MGYAIGTSRRQHIGPCRHRLFEPEVRESFPFHGLHPDPAAAAAAAKTVLERIRHFGQFQSRYFLQHFAGFVVDVVVATQVAGIMIGHFFVVLPAELEPARFDQLGHILGDMNHLEIYLELRILVGESVVAMGGRKPVFSAPRCR